MNKKMRFTGLLTAITIFLSMLIIPNMTILGADNGQNYMTVINYEDAFKAYGNETTLYANTVENLALVSWWESGEIPSGVDTQQLYSKYSMGAGVATGNYATIAYENSLWQNGDWTSTMNRGVRLTPAATDTEMSAVFAMKNGGGVVSTNEITSEFANSQAVVIRMSVQTHPGLLGKMPSDYPGVYFDLYEKKDLSTDNRDVGERFVAKSAADLLGTTVYMVDATTFDVTSKELGTISTDPIQQELSTYFVPEGFDGYIILPLSYFAYSAEGSLQADGNQILDASKLAGLRVGARHPNINAYSYLWMGEIGLTNNIQEYVLDSAHVEKDFAFTTDTTQEIQSSTFSAYKNTSQTITAKVTDNEVLQYSFAFSAQDITNPKAFNPKVTIQTLEDAGLNDLIANSQNALCIQTDHRGTLPGKATLTLKADGFAQGEKIKLYTYSKLGDKLIKMLEEPIVDNGYASFTITHGGLYIFSKTTCQLSKGNSGGYIKMADFEFAPFTDEEIVGENQLYDSNVLLKGKNIGTGTTNSNNAFAYGNSGVSIQFWPLADNAECSGVFNLINTLDNGESNLLMLQNSNALVVRIASNNAGLTNPSPEIFFTLYEDGQNGGLSEAFVGKTTSELDGEYGYLLPKDDTVQRIDLGVSGSFIPSGFDGWAVIPLSYFTYSETQSIETTGDQKLDLTHISALRIGSKSPSTALTFAIDEIGFVDNINSFVLEKSNGVNVSPVETPKTVKIFENHYLKAVDFEFNPLTEFSIVAQQHIYGNNVLFTNNTVGATAGIKSGLYSGFTGTGTVNSNSEFAYGNLKTAIQFWPENKAPCSATFNILNANDNGGISSESFANAKALVVRLSSREIDWMNEPSPGFYFDLYEVNDNGTLSECYTRKSAVDLMGTTIYLVNAKTNAVIPKELGTISSDQTEQDKSTFFIPNGFDGYAIIPLSYFTYDSSSTVVENNKALDMNKIGGVRIGVQYPDESFTYAIDEIGFADDIDAYVKALYASMQAEQKPITQENSQGYIPVVNFEFSPLTEFDIVPEQHIFNNNVLVKDKNVGVGTVNSNKAFNYGNKGISIQFWPLLNNSECSGVFNLKNNLDNDNFNMKSLLNSEAIVIRMASRDVSWLTDPQMFFDLYESNDWGELGEMFSCKSASELIGVSAYLLDANTKEVTEVELGTDSKDKDLQKASKSIVPTKFDGYVIIPLSYFTYNASGDNYAANKSLDLDKLTAIRIGASNSVIDWTFAIDEIGFTKSIKNFIELNGKLADKIIDMQMDDIQIVPKSVFEKYQNQDCNVVVRVLNGNTIKYEWTFAGISIITPMDFNPATSIKKMSDEGYGEGLMNVENAVCITTEFEGVLPGRSTLKVNIALDFFDDTVLYAYSYDNEKKYLMKLSDTTSVTDGYAILSLFNGGTYLLNDNLIVAQVEGVQEDDTEVNNPDVNKKWDSKNWFYMIIIIGGVVIIGGGTTAAILVYRKRKNNDIFSEQ